MDRYTILQEIGCIVCRIHLQTYTPTEIHHCLTTSSRGFGKRAGDDETIPLCPVHHRHGDGGQRFKNHTAIHQNLKEFENKYMPEKDLLEIVNIIIDKIDRKTKD